MIRERLSTTLTVSVAGLIFAIAASVACASDPLQRASYTATDSLKTPADSLADALLCLEGLCWSGEEFSVRCIPTNDRGMDGLIQFPSARPVGIKQNDTVQVEWYAARTPAGKLKTAPAMVVVHESGRGMTVGRMVARGLRDRGIHGFMIQLPFYGHRRPAQISVADRSFEEVMRQGIADVRRTRDAIAVLPTVDSTQISLQGTSLGGFLSATTAGLDGAFQNVFILLAGGNLPKLIETGERETAEVRELLHSQGFSGPALRKLLGQFEPNRLAHRINQNRLWVYTAIYDTTVPPAHADAFAKAAGLADDHHIRMPATHYSGVVFLPLVLDQIAQHSGGVAITGSRRHRHPD